MKINNKNLSMDNCKYMKTLIALDDLLIEWQKLIFCWKNGLEALCEPFTGICETDLEPGEEGYAGEYDNTVKVIKIIQNGNAEPGFIYNGFIEINLYTIPQKIMLEDGTVLWENNEDC